MAATSSAHIYCRVSSQGQEDGYSLDTQERACRDFAAQRGLAVASVAREVWSGGDRHRPQLDAAIDRLGQGDTLLCYALDRLSRSQVDTAILVDRIESAGASLALVTEDFEKSATGTFLRGAKAFAAELEREKIAERTQRGRRARAASGKAIPGSQPPYGYQWANAEKSRLMLDPETAPIVRRIFDMALDGTSLRAIATSLEASAVPTPARRGHWSAPTVRTILLRETYGTGDRTAYALRFERRAEDATTQRTTKRPRYTRRPARDDERIAVPGVAPAIVTSAEQSAVMARLALNKQHAPRNNRNPELALLRSGFVRCAYCGRAMRVKSVTPRGRGPQYICNDGIDCPHPAIAVHIIDAAAWANVEHVLRRPAIVAQELAKQRQDGSMQRELDTVARMLTSIADKQSRIARRVAGIDDDEVAAPLIAELHALAARKAAAESEHARLQRRITDQAAEDARIRSLTDWCRTVGANIERLTYDEKRLALTSLGVEVRIFKHGATDASGQPLDRWEMAMRPAPSAESIVLRASCSASAGSTCVGRR